METRKMIIIHYLIFLHPTPINTRSLHGREQRPSCNLNCYKILEEGADAEADANTKKAMMPSTECTALKARIEKALKDVPNGATRAPAAHALAALLSCAALALPGATYSSAAYSGAVLLLKRCRVSAQCPVPVPASP